MLKIIYHMSVVIIVAVIARDAIASDYKCAAGYYLNDSGECAACNPNAEPVYCPGDDLRHPCPTTDTDYNQF